ncbi:MAG: NAD-dependent epimerase/dehydratase family protein [Gammaproteobacteria bacterium]|nr:NAD-dependent epimerase/dehydratase family protein [Gammaproteobacteria bacterium]
MTRAAIADNTTLIVGTGYVGRRVLKEQHGNAFGLNRSSLGAELPATTFDLDTDAAMPVTLPGSYAVLYTVAPSDKADNDVRLEKLLRLLQPAPQRFVYISTTGVYGDHAGNLVTEDTPPQPKSNRALRRLAAETLLHAWGDEHSVDVVILRVPGIYGPGRLGIERIREGMAIIQESDANPGNRIHVDDLTTCCIAALANDTPVGIYNVGDGDFRSPTWFSNEVARQCRLEAPPTISRADAQNEFSEMRLSFLRESRRIDTRKMRDMLGVIPRYSNPEDGIRASLLS